jgi:hypothetical protein
MRVRSIVAADVAAACLALVATPASAQASTGSVTAVHGIPGVPVDVYVNGDLTIPNFEFGTVTDPLSLPPGTYEVEIFAAGDDPDTDDPVLSGSAEVAAGGNYSVVAYLSASGDPALKVFVNDTASIPAGQARVFVRHTAEAPAVDVLVGGSAVVTNLANPDQAGPLDVPAGTISAAVAPTGTTTPVIGPADLDLAAGTAYFVYAVGSPDSQGGSTLQLLVQPISGLGAPAATPGETPGSTPVHSPVQTPVRALTGSGGLLPEGDGVPALAIVVTALAAMVALGAGTRLVLARR